MDYVLDDLDLTKYVEGSGPSAKLAELLSKIGASSILNRTKVIRYEVLFSAMRVLGYDFDGQVNTQLKKGLDFRMLNSRSVRILNRFAEIIALYQSNYEQTNQG